MTAKPDQNLGPVDWLRARLPQGSVLHIGAHDAPIADHDRDGTTVTTVEQITGQLHYRALFDHVVIASANAVKTDPVGLVSRVHEAMKKDGTLLLVVPFGVTGPDDGNPLYLGSVQRLVEPLFAISEVDVLAGHIVLAAIRREPVIGAPTFDLDLDERAFAAQERVLAQRARDSAAQVVQSGARYRGALGRIERLQGELDRVKRELEQLRGRIRKLRPFYAFPLATYRRVKRLRQGVRPSGVDSGTRAVAPASTAQAAPQAGPAPTTPAGSAVWTEALRAGFEQWVAAARAAQGDEVVVMFSGTTFVQEARANRPIRLTRVYLKKRCPVFFNYYRWSDKDALPEHPDELLFQSPIDFTPKLLDELITADFGGKKKIFFASFPHETMVRWLTLAAQHGWVTVYDSRDDWEEFAKVGMAKWHHPGYERYVVQQADIVSAVSRPLARKMSALVGGREVHVSPNGLDPEFPLPRGPRRPSKRAPVVGYFGHLTDKWFDWPLVIAAAQRYPQYTFELAGHGQPKLDLPGNVRLLGLMGHNDLADRSRSWSLALIPFKNSPLADAVDPIKVYEYLHLGLPVLATYFPQCREYPGTYITEGREEFLELMPKLIGTELPRRETESWLSENTWEQRVRTYSAQADDVRRRGRTGLKALLEGKP